MNARSKDSMRILRFMATVSCALLTALLNLSCTALPKNRSLPNPPPLWQVVVDAESKLAIRREASCTYREQVKKLLAARQRNPHHALTASFTSGLLIPVSADGYCLTAAHLVEEGGTAFVPWDARHGTPLFFEVLKDGAPGLSTLHQTGGRVISATNCHKAQSVQPLPTPRSEEEFSSAHNELAGLDAGCLVPLKTIKVWKSEDIALVKAPFRAPCHLPIAPEEPAVADTLMLIGNPMSHQKRLSTWTCRLSVADVKPYCDALELSFSEFHPLILKPDKFVQRGDSGGPALNSAGELVGVSCGVVWAGPHRMGNVYVGLRPEVIHQAIRDRSKRGH